jgi:predicted nucleic acid-binding protein
MAKDIFHPRSLLLTTKLNYEQRRTVTRMLARVEFYESFFSGVTLWATKLEQIVQIGNHIASTYGLAAMDALHLAAALSVDAEEFVTTEKTTQPMHRVTEIKIVLIATE